MIEFMVDFCQHQCAVPSKGSDCTHFYRLHNLYDDLRFTQLDKEEGQALVVRYRKCSCARAKEW